METTGEKTDFHSPKSTSVPDTFAKPKPLKTGSGIDVDTVRREEAIRLRDEFLQIASHELKTPIASLQLQLQLIKRQLRRVTDREVQLETFIHEIDASLRQVAVLTHLINDLLDVSKIQSGQLAIQPEPLELTPLLADILDRYSEMLKGAGCALETKLAPAGEIMADPARLEQVFVVLISNVCKYAPNSNLHVLLEANADDVRLQFDDDGPGIPAEHLHSVHERFARGEAGVNVSGLGLGLYIAKGIIEAHGGKIAVANRAKGLSVTIELPRVNSRV